MPRYFFHVTNGDMIPDEFGEEFDLVEEARGHALTVARELTRGGLPDRFAGHHISVVDERGVVVFTVLLRVLVVLAVLLLGPLEVFC
jgi:hypothetical protein